MSKSTICLKQLLAFLALFISLFKPLMTQAQYKITRVNDFYSFIQIYNPHSASFNLDNQFHFTSLKIELDEPYTGKFQVIEPFNQITDLHFSHHCDDINEKYASPLHIFSNLTSGIQVYFGNYSGSLRIHFFNVPEYIPSSKSLLKKAGGRCDKPEMISYTEWRKGLPEPKPPRERTETDHLVIHHSAGNNSDTNYINTVRNIYLLHTQTNGWDDIGYNFLVAPNGIIFNGRDPLGIADDDNILGAHFCAKNQNTMGICLLGDFTNTKPSKAALFSLNYLIAWKLKKDSLNPFGQSIHPRLSGTMLNTICGHRDGCNTSCPGDSLYPLLNAIQLRASKIADSCGLILGINGQDNKGSFSMYPNPSFDAICISLPPSFQSSFIIITNPIGQVVYQSIFYNKVQLHLGLQKGVYYYHIKDGPKGRLVIN
jgi:hypothetical protein